MNDEEYMHLAIAEAKKGEAGGGLPLGCVIVKDDEIIAAGTSHVGELFDPTAHGECTCMKEACQKMKSLNLSGCTLFTTLECCSMCLGCAGWTGLSRIVFGAYKEDAPGNPYEITTYHAEEYASKFDSFGRLDVTAGVLREECITLMKHVSGWQLVK